MDFRRTKAISPIIATLLLIAIAVAAGIVVYVFVNGLSGNLTGGGGQQTTERLQMQSFNFVIPAGTCACSGQILQIYLLNSGSASSQISAVYFDGALETIAGSLPIAGTSDVTPAASTAYLADSTHTVTSGSAGKWGFSTGATAKTSYSTGDVGQVVMTFSSAVTPGTTHTVKVISTTGATFFFTVTAGRVG